MHEVAEGDGPVNALDGALRHGAGEIFSQTEKGHAHRLQGAHSRRHSPARRRKTRVLIESTDGKREWGTVGVSENIIEASLQALVDSMEFALLKK